MSSIYLVFSFVYFSPEVNVSFLRRWCSFDLHKYCAVLISSLVVFAQLGFATENITFCVLCFNLCGWLTTVEMFTGLMALQATLQVTGF